jgi:hypothetical protein
VVDAYPDVRVLAICLLHMAVIGAQSVGRAKLPNAPLQIQIRRSIDIDTSHHCQLTMPSVRCPLGTLVALLLAPACVYGQAAPVCAQFSSAGIDYADANLSVITIPGNGSDAKSVNSEHMQ